MQTEVSSEIMLIATLIMILCLLSMISFVYYGLKIYKTSCTFKSLTKWMFSYLLIFSADMIFRYPLSLESMLRSALGYFVLIFAFIILFYLLRVEERELNYKYIKGLIISFILYLVSSVSYFFLRISDVLSNLQISLLNSFYTSIFILFILLFFIYTLKILFNYFMENERINYPIIFFVLLVGTLISGSAISGFRQSLSLLYNLILLILTVNLVFYFDWIKRWLKYNPKKDNINQNITGSHLYKNISFYIDRFLNKEISIEKSEYSLNDEINNAIINSKCLDLENKDLKELKFMLVCANQTSEALNRESSFAQNLVFSGMTLIILPFIEVITSFFDYMSSLQMNLITKTPDFEPIIKSALDKLDISAIMLIYLIFMYVLFFIMEAVLTLPERDNKIKIFIRRNKIVSIIYDLLPLVIIIGLVIKWAQSSKIDIIDIYLISVGLMFYIFGSLITSQSSKKITNAYKVILDLNNKIIFYEK